MNKSQRAMALKVTKALLPPEEYEKVMAISINDLGFGYDMFGLEREAAIVAYAFAQYLYEYWFRVESQGHEHVPETGPALIVPNHSGVLPIDAAMVAVDMVKKMNTPRIARAMVDNFMGFLPFVNTLFYRVGQVVGARRNFEDLLKNGELVSVFPEGAKGTGKLFSQRYHLMKFNVGFIELSLTYKSPIVPTAIIGAEEQAPMLANFKPIARVLGFPYFPITPTFPWLGPIGVIPLPIKYRIQYGEPFRFYEEYPPDTVKDPEKIRVLAEKVKGVVQEMVTQGLKQRKSIFAFNSTQRVTKPRRKRRM